MEAISYFNDLLYYSKKNSYLISQKSGGAKAPQLHPLRGPCNIYFIRPGTICVPIHQVPTDNGLFVSFQVVARLS